MPPRIDARNGEKHGKLTILESTYKDGIGYLKVQCDCGHVEEKRKYPILSGRVSECIKCTEKIRGEKRRKGGFKDVSGTIMGKIRRNAENRNLKVEVSPEFLYNLYIRQDKKCTLTGLDISLEKTNKRHSCNASLDRIDSSKGYTEENVQWVHQDVNFMKQDFNQTYFIDICKKVSSKCS